MAGPSERYADAFKRVEIEDKTDLVPGGVQPEDISEFALEAFQKYNSVLIIVNTRKMCKEDLRRIEEIMRIGMQIISSEHEYVPEKQKR